LDINFGTAINRPRRYSIQIPTQRQNFLSAPERLSLRPWGVCLWVTKVLHENDIQSRAHGEEEASKALEMIGLRFKSENAYQEEVAEEIYR